MNKYFKIETPDDIFKVIPFISLYPRQTIFNLYRDMNDVIDKYNLKIEVHEPHVKFIKNASVLDEIECKTRLMNLANDIMKCSKNMKLPVKILRGKSFINIATTISIENINELIEYLECLFDKNDILNILNNNDKVKCSNYFTSIDLFTKYIYHTYISLNKARDIKIDYLNEIVVYDILIYATDKSILNKLELSYDINNIVRSMYKLALPVRYTIYSLLTDEYINDMIIDTFNEGYFSYEYSIIFNDKFQYDGIIKYLENNKELIPISNKIDIFTKRNLIISEIAELLINSNTMNNLNGSTLLGFKDIVYLSSKVDKIYTWNVIDGMLIMVATKNDIDYIIINNGIEYVLYEMNNQLIQAIKSNSIPLSIYKIPYDKKYVIESTLVDYDDMSSLTEGIDIDKDGNVTFTFSAKKTFMTQYAENHRELVNNMKVGNIGGVKTNLAFIFAMISVIERDIIHSNKKISDEKIEDAKQARMFARNDFATYLPQVQQLDKKFDFSKYYHDNNYDKFILTLNSDSITGIKKLVNKLLILKF